MRSRSARPGIDDVSGQQDTAERVEPPDFGKVSNWRMVSMVVLVIGWICDVEGRTERENDAEDVEYDVGFCVLGEGLHARVADQAAPEPADEFDDYGGCHDGDGRNGELDDGVVVACDARDALDGDLEETSNHDDGEDLDALVFVASMLDDIN